MMLRQFVFGVARALVLVSVIACSAANFPELAADDSAAAEKDDASHDDAGHDDAGHDDAGHDDAGHDDAGHDDAGHDDAGHDDAGHDDAGHDDAGHDDAGHDDAGHDDAADHETGVPIAFTADLALWSLIVFLIFLFVLKKTAWGPMIEGLDKREAGIRAAIAEAEEGQRKSQATLADYEEKLRGAEQTVAEMVAEAKRDAERTSQDIVAKAQADVESMRERAKEDIGRAKDAALAEVFSTVNSQVALATERVLGRALSDGDQERLIQEALSGISG